MTAKGKIKRRRCCSCRRWYYPHPSAEQNQRTCNDKCRVKRRNLLARRRREQNLQDYRVDERERQRRRRKKLREAMLADRGNTLVSSDLSRAGLPLQTADLQETILKNWDKQSRLSRASLRRDLEALLGIGGNNWDKVGQKIPSVTHHPLSITS